MRCVYYVSSHTSYQNFAELTCLQPNCSRMENLDDDDSIRKKKKKLVVSLTTLCSVYRYIIKIIIKRNKYYSVDLLFLRDFFLFLTFFSAEIFPRQIFRQNVYVLGIATETRGQLTVFSHQCWSRQLSVLSHQCWSRFAQ